MEINSLRQAGEVGRAAELASQLKLLGGILGLFQLEPLEFLRGIGGDEQKGGLGDSEIDALLEERQQARAAKNWARADEIRDMLKENNIVLDDGAGGTRWRRE